ncbi:dCTP deaminase/dUTPase family protein [Blattabacterium cuenoti]|uniref:dUTP diphosphatase n=1 Tax=Blattabacterium cuenoti TaxID=1653831 RepID=UPI001EEC6BC5|nr:dUTP diphosphatase [Blattabacterium cuenoti]
MERKLISTGIFIKISKETRCSFLLRRKFVESICIVHLSEKKEHSLYKEIQIIAINVFFKKIMIEPNEKLVIVDLVKDVEIKWKKCSILSRSMRGNNSFGSTGI